MVAAQAISKKVGASHKRLRPLMNMVKGMKVNDAIKLLELAPSPWSISLLKTLKSAVANAENNLLMDKDVLKIVRISADPATSLRRFKPHARGRVGKMHRRSSHITVVVDEEGV